MDWIIHLDTDELIHPAGTQEYSMRQLLSDVPGNVDMVIFPNYVSLGVLFRSTRHYNSIQLVYQTVIL
jgi:hypothetical protein